MNFKKWTDNQSFTLGAELEVRLQDSKSMELKDYSSVLREKLSKEYKNRIHQEFLECMVEFVTPVCNTSYEVINELKKEIKYLQNIAKDYEIVLATSGSHSFEVNKLKHVNEKRYDDFAREYGVILSRFHICGFHIHVALSSSEDAIRAYNYILEYLPVFLALSANSPFFNGENTGVLSYRAKLFEQLPRAGLSSYFDSFEQMKSLYDSMGDAGTIHSAKDIWWDLRISPSFGTLEIRICDASNDFERLRLLVVLYQALVLFSLGEPLLKIPRQILLQNRWNALRHGMKGVFQNTKVVTTIKNHFLNLVENMDKKGVFDQLGSKDEIEKLKSLVFEEEPAKKQLKIYEDTGSLLEVEKLGKVTI